MTQNPAELSGNLFSKRTPVGKATNKMSQENLRARRCDGDDGASFIQLTHFEATGM